MENLHNLTAADGHEIRLKIWQPAGEARGVIQLLHGLGEHIGRYQRFAAAAVDRGLIVCAHDHRGHGEFRTEAGYFADAGGWHKVVEDVRVVNDHVREQFADQPVVLLGHSMGSFIAQTFAMHYGTRLAGLLLSGSNWPRRLELLPGVLVAWIEGLRLGRHGTPRPQHTARPARIRRFQQGVPSRQDGYGLAVARRERGRPLHR